MRRSEADRASERSDSQERKRELFVGSKIRVELGEDVLAHELHFPHSGHDKLTFRGESLVPDSPPFVMDCSVANTVQ